MLHILICDDDTRFCDLFSKTIARFPEYDCRRMKVKAVSDAESLTNDIVRAADMVFMDVAIGRENGIALAHRMRAVNRNFLLIIVSGGSEFSDDAFEVNAFRYLQKQKMSDKLHRYFREALQECEKEKPTIIVVNNRERSVLMIDHIVYAVAKGHMVRMYMDETLHTTIETRESMRGLQDRLRSADFLRIHNSYLVNLNYVVSLNSSGAVLVDGKRLPVSLHRYQQVKSQYEAWKSFT